MTKIKLCGLTQPCDIQAANELRVDYIGFVFAKKSRRYLAPEKAAELKRLLSPDIQAVGVFVDETPETIAAMLQSGVIDAAQLHGGEGQADIYRLKQLTDRPIIKAFQIGTASEMETIEQSAADYVLLDSGAGTGTVFDWGIIHSLTRPYFLAGGLNPGNVGEAVRRLSPFAVDVSSGIETNGRKDQAKMQAFVSAVRKEEKR